MRLVLTLLLTGLSLARGAAAAERYSLSADRDSEEGRYLQLIGLQSTEEERIGLLERFTRKHPGHPSIPWVYEQLQIAYLSARQFDKAIATGAKLLEICPDDFEAARRSQMAAESTGSPELVEFWTKSANQIARRIAGSAAPQDSQGLSIWKEAAAVASQAAAQGDYALVQRAEAAATPAEQIRLLDELRQQNPETPYSDRIDALYLQAYRIMRDYKNVLLYVERILAKDQENEDALLGAAEAYFETRSPKATPTAIKLIHILQVKPKPSQVPEEDWMKKRAAYTGSASWIAGAMYVAQNQFAEAERMLRRSLASLRESDARVAPVLFYLGWSNYKLSNNAEALRYYQQCSAIKSTYQEQAMKNLDAVAIEMRRGQRTNP